MAQSKAVILALAFGAGASCVLLGGAIRTAQAHDEPRSAYFCFEASNVGDLQAKANAAGQRGWQMVSGVGSAAHGVWCFTRSRAE